MNCQSCGLPMMIDADHGGGKPDNVYCRYCTDEAGNLKTKEEIREGMINLYMQSFGKPREEAEKEVDGRMAQMPAWMGGESTPVSTEVSQPTPIAAEPITTVQPAVSTAVPSTAPETPVVPPAPSVIPSPEPISEVPTPPSVSVSEASIQPPSESVSSDQGNNSGNPAA